MGGSAGNFTKQIGGKTNSRRESKKKDTLGLLSEAGKFRGKVTGRRRKNNTRTDAESAARGENIRRGKTKSPSASPNDTKGRRQITHKPQKWLPTRNLK